jgi:hypothetical protein
LLFISCTILDTSLGVKVSGDLAENSHTQFCIDRSLVEQRKQSLLENYSAPSELMREYQVLLAPSGMLCDGEVVGLQCCVRQRT